MIISVLTIRLTPFLHGDLVLNKDQQISLSIGSTLKVDEATTASGATRTNEMMVRGTNYSSYKGDSCRFYLAESALPNAGLGVYTVIDLQEGEFTQPLSDLW